jgi:hypothetical protein
MVGGVVAHPVTGTEPCMKLSLHTAPQHTSLCHRHSIEDDCSPWELGICAVGIGLASGLQYASFQRVPKTQIRLPLCLLVCRPHVSLSQALPWAFALCPGAKGPRASWGIPPTRAYGLATSSHS